jgi:actin related protein 2/3 complex subunit 1A/1B
VWTYDDSSSEWKPSLVILRINRAALDVKWSPNGEKFAVASGSKCVPVCHFDPKNDWWISKMIKKHKSTVLSVSWHPDGQLLLTGCADFKCRVFSGFIDELDQPVDGLFGDLSSSFGDLLADFDSSLGWVEAATWSPSGNSLAFAGHDSSLSIVTFVGKATEEAPTLQCLKLKGRPFQSLTYLNEQVIVAGGHDYNPYLFSCEGGNWNQVGTVDNKSSKKTAAATSNKFNAARSMFGNMARTGQTGQSDSSKIWTKHDNNIMKVCQHGPVGEPSAEFSTSGLDGRIILWDLRSAEGVDFASLPGF